MRISGGRLLLRPRRQRLLDDVESESQWIRGRLVLDELVTTANTTPDQEERKQALNTIAERIADDVPMIPLYYYRGYVAVHDYIKNIPTPSGADPNNTGIYYKVWELDIQR